MSDGTHGHGTTLTGSTSGVIGNIMNISTDRNTDVLDKSTMDSPSEMREKLAGMKDAGELTITLNYDGSAAGVANALHAAWVSGTAETWTIVSPDGSTDSGSGFIVHLGEEIPFDNKIIQNVTIARSGLPTFTDVA